MKSKKLVAAVCASATLALTASACSSSSTTSPTSTGSSGAGSSSVLSTDGKGKTINVWIMTDAQKGWPDVVNSAVTRFEAATGAKVDINWTTWSGYTTKIEAAIKAGGSGVPDVVEVGDTDTASFIANGEFADLTSGKSQFDNSSTWLSGLTESSESADGSKLYAIPYYAGDRVAIYRTDLFKKAGLSVPTTLADLESDAATLKAKGGVANLTPYYVPGKDWYVALSFVFGAGGGIATDNGGTWTGTLESAASEQGLATWAKLEADSSVAGQTKDETDQDAIMAQGNSGLIFGAGWEAGSVTAATGGGNPKLANDIATFPIPGTTAGTVTPTFLGGSDLAVPANAPEAGLGAEFIKYYTDTTSETMLAKYAMPNNTTLMSTFDAASPGNAVAGAAAASSWFVPNTPAWSNVESQNILQNMLESIATGKSTVDAAAKSADQQIAQILNAG
ncbi:extracellular solute-binding protein [Actinospica durhamensis]|uniref:Extracellular solute-binding protein n=1 Tax=Actinospica durhamensis TaxID=1508375 RepID=A0A941EMR0_9ACTN|nr:extracellular solute-binding protein [Actinospica durhamensis]MBR7835265.1 extracellular solute-binding protein [Actinospica durhamensis]